MVSARSYRLGALLVLSACVLLGVSIFPHRAAVHAQTPVPDQLTIYAAQTTYSVPLVPVKGQRYVGLVEALEPLGFIDARPDGNKYKVRFTRPGGQTEEAQFTNGKPKCKVHGQELTLPAPFVLQNGRGYVPLAAIGAVVLHFTSQETILEAEAGRLFVGNVQEHFALDLRKDGGSRLFISFPSPVNPSIATEPGHVRFTFRREPVVASGKESTKFEDALITGARFSEQNGTAELDIIGSAPLMANFADGGKTIVVTAAPAPAPPSVAQQPAAPQSQAAAPPATPQPPQAPAAARFLVLIDPAHGGSDIGAAISPSLTEKEVVLALARRVQRECNNRGLAATLLRNSDTGISLPQRAVAINAARPALYLALHAANTGRGVHVFTSLLPPTSLSPHDFLPWETAQSAFLDLSGSVAGSIAAELDARKLPNSTLPAPLAPMDSVAAPAVAVEIAAPGENVDEIASPAYQEQVAQSIAAGILAIRSKLPEVRP